jgi:hypothetical protein
MSYVLRCWHPEAGPEWGGSFTLTRRPEYRTVRDLCRKWALNEDCWPAEGCDVEVHWTLERKRSGRIVDEGDYIICVPPYSWDVLVTFRRNRRWVDLRWQYHDFPRPTESEIQCDFAHNIKKFGRFRGRVRWVATNNRDIPDVDGSFVWDSAAERLYATG